MAKGDRHNERIARVDAATGVCQLYLMKIPDDLRAQLSGSAG